MHASLRRAETFMRACRRLTEAACLCARKCASNHQQVCQLAHAVFDWETWGSYETWGGCGQLCTVTGARVGWEGGKGAQADGRAQACRQSGTTKIIKKSF